MDANAGSAPGLVLKPAIAAVSGPAAISSPFIAIDLFARSGWGLIAPFAFIIALGATVVFGGAWFLLTRRSAALSSPLAYALAGAATGGAAVAAAVFLFDADMLGDALRMSSAEGRNLFLLAAGGIGAISALVSRLAGARWAP